MSAGSGRTYVNGGKKNLSDDSEKLVTQVDDLQDTVEDLRKDVVQRGVRPLPRQLDVVSKDISTATSGLKKLQEFLKREKPIWTKIWEKELQVVCEDRDLLTMQEELCIDLEDDLEKAAETFALVEQATRQQNLQNAPRSSSRTLNPVALDRGGDPQKARTGVLGEVRALQPNHESRLEAIERAEKARQRELEERRDGEFQKELSSFVEEGKLKKSGGVEEAERLRKLKDERNPTPEAPPRYSQRKEEERTNYEHSCNERRDNENLVLQHDEYLFDPNDFLWAAACKFADVLESREPEITSDYYFSTSDVLVCLFINIDLSIIEDAEYLAKCLVMPLIKFFSRASSFRFAIFVPRPHVEGRKEVPKHLRYVFGTLEELGRSPNLEGASTDMEKKFVIREVRTMRRRSRMDHVQIHADSLEQGFFIAKVDGKDLNEEPLESCRLLQDVQGSKPTERIAIPPRPRANDVGAAWVVRKKGGVWA
ncbi:AIP3-domain-containing protein [Aureobasidium pullulans]|uniref:AIP3-domain-containing protein n=1 Tax=Aureobasidium pullulans TaxID=5580 RepID=A0A4T0DIK3_AURPU|nr:AIP3-domain-containing protein [Aureobasidium pullulans]